MKLGQAFKMAAKSIFSNIGRSALTMLGIIIGLAAVIILVSYAQGQNAAMRAYYESMGTNTVEVYAYTWDSSLDVSKSLYNYCLGLDNLVMGFTPQRAGIHRRQDLLRLQDPAHRRLPDRHHPLSGQRPVRPVQRLSDCPGTGAVLPGHGKAQPGVRAGLRHGGGAVLLRRPPGQDHHHQRHPLPGGGRL